MNVLEVRGLTKRYPAFTLNGVSFAVPEGAVMGFIGRNGAGKSTTLKSILGMVHPDGGEVKVFGMDYAANERAIRRELGVVLGGIDFYPKKKIRVITDVTRRFYDNWDEGKYRHYLNLFAIDEEKRVDQLSSVLFSTHITSDLEKCATHIAFIKDGEMQYTGSLDDFRDHYKDVGVTLEDIIVHVERRPLDEGAII